MARGINPRKSLDIARLKQAIKDGQKALEMPLATREAVMAQRVGHHYSQLGAMEAVPVNLLELFISVYAQYLSAPRPQCLCTSPFEQLRSVAFELELAVNHDLDEIRFGRTQRLVILESLIGGLGIAKLGLVKRLEDEVRGDIYDSGQVFIDPVYLPDWVHDPLAQRFELLSFMGDRYSLPTEHVKTSDLFEEKVRQHAVPNTVGGIRTDEQGRKRMNDTYIAQPYEDQTDCWDIYLPRERLLVTLLDDGPEEALAIRDWTGPERGPYHLLWYDDVPGEVMPFSQSGLLLDLHDTINDIWRKLLDQASRQKKIGILNSLAHETGEVIKNCGDGDVLTSKFPEAFREASIGGPDNVVLGMAQALQMLFSYLAGNLDTLAGLGQQADTLGQEKLLAATASQRMRSMQDRATEWTQIVVEDAAWYRWNSPYPSRPVEYQVPGTDFAVQKTFDPSRREGDFLDYNIRFDVFSSQNVSPGEKAAKLQQFVMNEVPLLMQVAQQQGKVVDIDYYISLLARYADMPELKGLFRNMETGEGVQSEREQPVSEQNPLQLPKSPVSTRNYVRHGRPGATQQGAMQVMMEKLMSGANGNGTGSSLSGRG